MNRLFLLTTSFFTASLMFQCAAASAGPVSLWYRNFNLEGGLTMVTQYSSGNSTEDMKDMATYAYTGDIGITGKLSDNQEIYFHLETGDGFTMDDNVGGRTAVNYDALNSHVEGATRLNVSQAYYTARMGDTMEISLGVMDVHSLTDGNEFAGDETAQFLNGLFVRSTGAIFPELDFYYAPAIYLHFQPADIFSLNFTYASREGYDLLSRQHIVMELGLHPMIAGGQGNYRFGYIINKQTFTDLASGEAATNAGFYASLDQAFGDLFGIFLRYASQDTAIAENEIASGYSAGISINGLMGNEDNGFGIAYGAVQPNKDIIYEFDEGEQVIELYLRLGVNEGTQLTIDLQSISNLERPDKRSVMVAGLRLQTGL